MSGQQQPSSVPPVPPQPFRFWLPYRSNVGSWRQQPRPMPASTRPQPPGPSPPPPAPAETAPRAPLTRDAEEDIPIQADSSDESDTIAVEALDSLRSRGARPAVADLELTLSRSPPPATGTSGDGGGDDAKITISGFPRARLFDGARAPYRREIEDGLKSLAGRETPPAPRPPDQGYRVITLAGHNVGASMVLGNGPSDAPPPRTANEPEGSSARPSPSVATNVNSNVQGVNNSTMEESTCNSGDPGVRVDIKNAHEKPVVVAPSKEPQEKPKEPARTVPPQEKSTAASGSGAAPAPPRRKRCLRALMIEERKPKPIACRFQCVADHAPAAAAANDPGSKSAEEGAKESTR